MKVILLQNVSKLGNKDDVKDVADGYALNFLIPSNLALPATTSGLSEIDRKKRAAQKSADKQSRELDKLKAKLEGQELFFER